MAKYSNIGDIQDELIKQFSKRSDHVEAEEYVDKVLTKLGIDTQNVVINSQLKRLAVTFASCKRSFYEAKTKDDIFYQKYLGYVKELKELTPEIIRVHRLARSLREVRNLGLSHNEEYRELLRRKRELLQEVADIDVSIKHILDNT